MDKRNQNIVNHFVNVIYAYSLYHDMLKATKSVLSRKYSTFPSSCERSITLRWQSASLSKISELQLSIQKLLVTSDNLLVRPLYSGPLQGLSELFFILLALLLVVS